MSCKVGGAVYAAHNEGCDILHEAAKAAGYQSRREQIVVEFATATCLSPKLDIEGWGVAWAERLLVDFTIRNPLADRYATGEARSDAAATAEEEKEQRYPPRGGVRVRGAALELYGKHGEGMRALLAEFADRARERERASGVATTRWIRRWRVQLSAVTVRLVGRAIQKAQSAPPPAS